MQLVRQVVILLVTYKSRGIIKVTNLQPILTNSPYHLKTFVKLEEAVKFLFAFKMYFRLS